MNNQNNDRWLQCWRDEETEDFHQKEVNQFLSRFWPSLNLARSSRIFVPLCGKSLDMIWLAKQGHEVIGIELSAIAIKAFFQENKLKFSKKRMGKFTVWSSGRIRILCGDFFSLKQSDLGKIEFVYDRASLTALPEDIRKDYVLHLEKILSNSTNMFLLTTEDIELDQASSLPYIDEEIMALYSASFDIDLTHVESTLTHNPLYPDQASTPTEYKVYRLFNKH